MPDTIAKHLLSWVIFLPIIGALILMFAFKRPQDEEDAHHHAIVLADGEVAPTTPNSANAIRNFTLFWSALTFALSLALLFKFDTSPGEKFQFVDGPFEWIPQFHVNYHIGIDGISLLLILLTTFLTLLSVGFSFNIKRRVKEYMIFLLLLETAMTGVFCALDLVLFYVFWEAVLIPMYFLIGIWGHDRRIFAAVKFFLYTFAGSVLMLVGIVYLYVATGSFSVVDLVSRGADAHQLLLGIKPQTMLYLFSAFSLAFMIKVPMFPFHTWLPDAHVEAPTAGSVILAGIMLKMGAYGFIRFALPLFPEQAKAAAPLFLALAVIGIVYGAVVATVQPDMKKLVAYSSVSHLGFVMLGIFSFTKLGLTGAVLQSVNHGISTGMLFFMVGMMYERKHTREISAYGGIKRIVPVFAAFFLIALLSSVALPLTNGFVGEFTILQGVYISPISGSIYAGIASTGMVLSAIYMLWMFQRVFTGPVTHESNKSLLDLTKVEIAVLVPLVALVFWIGCASPYWTKFLTAPVTNIQNDVGLGQMQLPEDGDPRVIIPKEQSKAGKEIIPIASN
ncbi:MAG: NADH-quinone oxidoreductase subunit M [Chthonomonadales bacterium]